MFVFQITYIKSQTTAFINAINYIEQVVKKHKLMSKQTIDLYKNCKSNSNLKLYKRRDDKMSFFDMSFPVGRISSLHSCPSSFLPLPLHCIFILDINCANLHVLQKARTGE